MKVIAASGYGAVTESPADVADVAARDDGQP